MCICSSGYIQYCSNGYIQYCGSGYDGEINQQRMCVSTEWFVDSPVLSTTT